MNACEAPPFPSHVVGLTAQAGNTTKACDVHSAVQDSPGHWPPQLGSGSPPSLELKWY